MSFNTSLSRLSSATNRFSSAFSCSSSLSRFAWSTCIPTYSLRQRKYVCSTISASLHAWAVAFPFAIATSICRSRFPPAPVDTACLVPCALLVSVCLLFNGTFQAGHSKDRALPGPVQGSVTPKSLERKVCGLCPFQDGFGKIRGQKRERKDAADVAIIKTRLLDN